MFSSFWFYDLELSNGLDISKCFCIGVPLILCDLTIWKVLYCYASSACLRACVFGLPLPYTNLITIWLLCFANCVVIFFYNNVFRFVLLEIKTTTTPTIAAHIAPYFNYDFFNDSVEEFMAGLEIRVVLWPQSTKTSAGLPDSARWWSGGLLENSP